MTLDEQLTELVRNTMKGSFYSLPKKEQIKLLVKAMHQAYEYGVLDTVLQQWQDTNIKIVEE